LVKQAPFLVAAFSTHSTSIWGYQALGERLILSSAGDLSTHTDNNVRQILTTGVQFRVLMNPLFKIKYFFVYGDYRYRAVDLAPPVPGLLTLIFSLLLPRAFN